MAEGRVAEVVCEAQRLGQVLIDTQSSRHAAADLGDLDRMGQADAEMVAVGGDEDLRLVAQAAESDRMDDAVAVALENVARAPRATVGFRMGPAA
jgi:hypothetical protein